MPCLAKVEAKNVGLTAKEKPAASPCGCATGIQNRAFGAEARQWSGGSAPEPPGYLRPDEGFKEVLMARVVPDGLTIYD